MTERPSRLYGRIIVLGFVLAALAASYLSYQGRMQREALKGIVEEGKRAKPALWQVKDADTTIYLFGSVHALPKGIEWLDGPVASAVNTADALVLEVADLSDSAMNDPKIAAMAYDTEVPSLADRVGPDNLAALQRRLGNKPHTQLDKMESWAVSLAFAQQSYAETGLSADHGVEQVILPYFKSTGRPVSGLETAFAQIKLLNDLPPAAQQTMLLRSLAPQDQRTRMFKPMLNAWAKGDMAQFERAFAGDFADNPVLYDRLIVARNRAWADWVKARMEQPGTVLMVVGAGHLVGKDSVQALLEPMGHQATRLQ